MKLRINSEAGPLLPADATQAGFLTGSVTASGIVPLEWYGRVIPFPRERTVMDYFQTLARSQPAAVAVKDGARLVTYAELDLLSDRVVNALRQQGLAREEPVAIMKPAACEFLAAVLGVLKAGGTYFPVDVDTPTKRLEFLLNDSVSRLVLSDEAGRDRLREWPGKVLDLAEVLRPDREVADPHPGVPADSNRRAYITYTSGSTGQPKGVEIEHHALTNLVCYYHRRLKLTPLDRASMLAYVAFDASVADIWPVLCAGGTILIPPKGILLDPDSLIEWLAAEEITLTFVPTGLAEILFARPWPERMKLRFLITGGDRLRVRPPAGLPFAVINGYGPTENTVFSTWSVVAPADGSNQPPPIGRPLDNTTSYVLDEQLQPVPVNEPGELYLGGEQVARGYLGRSGLTAERFVNDPFAGRPGARMYRTGDWVRWLADGELDFLGRRDGQIQIRGRRVELGEIEAVAFTHGLVRQVCCVPWLDEGMPSGVIAHIVPEKPGAGLADELRTYLAARLPDYMVPSEFVLHEVLPLTPQGKLDRAALTKLPAAKSASPQIAKDEDGLTKALARLWHSLLPAAQDSPAGATFATLGGDSLLAIKLMLGVEEIIRQRLEASAFLINPTLAGLCEAARKRLAQGEFEPVLAIRIAGTRPPVFCLYGYDGDIDDYFNLAEALGPDQPVYGIRSPALVDLSRLPPSMEAAAAEVVRWIRKVQPHGAPALVGYSWAGLLAFEVARQMSDAGGIRCCTVLIGTPAPVRPANFFFRIVHFSRYFPTWLWHLVTDRQNRRQRLLRWREMARGMEQSLVQAHLPLGGPSTLARHMIGLMEKYRPLSIPDLAVEVFRERDEYSSRPHPLRAWLTPHLSDGGWNRWTRRPNHIHWLAGDHDSILRQPVVADLAQTLRRALDHHQSDSGDGEGRE